MLYLVALAYWLLCVRIHVRLEAFFENGQGGAAFSAGALGAHARREYTVVPGEKPFSLRLKPCRERQPEKRKNSALSRFLTRLVKRILRDALRSGRFERIELRLSLGDACETAIAAGAVRALVCALLAGAGAHPGCVLRVMPDFDAQGLQAHAMGLFSCQAGDIMLAALKAARGT